MAKGSLCNRLVKEIPGKVLPKPVQGARAHMIGYHWRYITIFVRPARAGGYRVGSAPGNYR
jgi:hypothetical protein